MAVRPTATGNAKTDLAIQQVRDALPNLDVLKGLRLIPDVQLTDGTTRRIAHGLKRKLRGWLVVRSDSGNSLATLYDEQRQHNDTDVYLYLRATGYSPMVSLLVF